jgi:predicted HAD superfamily Cof-like phosphohydrolase
MTTESKNPAETISAAISEAKRTAQSPLEFQAQLVGIIATTLANSHSSLESALAPDEMMRHIAQFHEKFGLAYEGDPRQLPQDLRDFRVRFMEEELREYVEACINGDLEKQFDALIDLVYVALGTAYLQGLPFRKGWLRVQAANMAKVRTQKPTERGGGFDVVKPKGWIAPVLSDLI